LAFHLCLFEFCGAARIFHAACLLFSITASTLAKGSILLLAKGTIACTVCGRRSKSFQEWHNTGK
jgi:hypothetical protein